MRPALAALATLACLLAPGGSGGTERSAERVSAEPSSNRPHVYLIIVDGLDARFATPARMPRLFELAAREPERSSIFTDARAVMPARTNPNHVSLLTGAYPEAHGITGNAYWSRAPEERPTKLDAAALIAVETLFTVAEETEPTLVTLGAFAKPKLARLFAAVPGRQRAPDTLWSPERASPAGRDTTTGYSFDAETMTAVLALAADAEPDLAVVNLADVDRAAHARGPDSPECERAVAGADAAIDRLADALRALGRWGRSVLIVTADHGFSGLAPSAERPYPVITFGRDLQRAGVSGVHLVSDGGVEHVYADGLAGDATEVGDGAPRLARVAELAGATPGVAEVLARLPGAGVPLLGSVHPGWHLVHPRTGELLLVAARGYQFVDPFDPEDASLLGNHGGPGELAVPLVVTGGFEGLKAAPPSTPAPVAVDVAPTIAALLALRRPNRVDGSPLPPAQTGSAIAAVLAGRPLGAVPAAQSPH